MQKPVGKSAHADEQADEQADELRSLGANRSALKP
jgi:hypothetical protein